MCGITPRKNKWAWLHHVPTHEIGGKTAVADKTLPRTAWQLLSEGTLNLVFTQLSSPRIEVSVDLTVS